MILSDTYLGYTTGTNALISGRTANGSTYFPLKNRIINGDFRVNQISTTLTASNVTTVYYTIDRWWTRGAATGRFTTQIVDDGPNAASGYFAPRRSTNVSPGTTLRKCVEIKCTAATTLGSTDVYAFGQNIEGRHVADMEFGLSNANFMILSFWAKASRTGAYTVRLHNSAQNRTFHQVYNVATANTWEYHEVIIPIDTTGTWLNTIDTGLRVIFNLGIGTAYRGTLGLGSWTDTSSQITYATNATSIQLVDTLNSTLRLTGIQLEFFGTTNNQNNIFASPFETRSFQQELDLCMRYFQKSWAYGTAPGTQTVIGMLLHTDLQFTTVQQYLFWKWPIPMRAAPTVEVYGFNSPGTAGLCYLWNQNISGLGDYGAAVSGASRYGTMFYTTASVNHALAGFHYKANAEPA
jgi:hypothetical protein